MNRRFMKHCLSFVSICFMAFLFLIVPAEVNGEEEKPDNGIGEVTIRATLKSGKSRDFTLKVVEGSTPDPEKIIAPDTVKMKTGENKALVVATEPEFAKIDMYEYESDNEEVVSVDSFGVLTAKKRRYGEDQNPDLDGLWRFAGLRERSDGHCRRRQTEAGSQAGT